MIGHGCPLLTKMKMFDFQNNSLMAYAFIIANVLKGSAFVTIAFTLLYVWNRKKELIDSWVLLAFASFLLSSACARFIDCLLPFYRLNELYVFFLTLAGVLSALTAVLLPLVIKKSLRLLTKQEYHDLLNNLQREISRKQVAIMQKDKIIEELKIQINRIEAIHGRESWFQQQGEILTNLRTLLRK